MKTIEERLWDFIDGTCTTDEKYAIERSLQSDPTIKALYAEFIYINQNLKVAEPDEPSMRFTQNVMDKIALEPATKALQTQIDKRIINGIAALLLAPLSVLLIFMFTQLQWSEGKWNFSNLLSEIQLHKLGGGVLFEAAIVAFMVTALFVIDQVLQYRKTLLTYE
ncbi:MAG: hypothetical protein ABIQ74_00475 [Chitinophagales bacterium]